MPACRRRVLSARLRAARPCARLRGVSVGLTMMRELSRLIGASALVGLGALGIAACEDSPVGPSLGAVPVDQSRAAAVAGQPRAVLLPRHRPGPQRQQRRGPRHHQVLGLQRAARAQRPGRTAVDDPLFHQGSAARPDASDRSARLHLPVQPDPGRDPEREDRSRGEGHHVPTVLAPSGRWPLSPGRWRAPSALRLLGTVDIDPQSPCVPPLRPHPAVTPGVVMADERSLCPPAMRLRALSIERLGADRAIELVGLRAQPERRAQQAGKDRQVPRAGADHRRERRRQGILRPGGAPVRRRAGRRPFVPVNCPQYQEGNLTVSELFGHTRGSFTGAVADRKGAFEEADGGVIFLDEIADLHASAQVMLLRALATGEFRPVGADPLADGRRPRGVGDQPAAEPAGDDKPVPLRPAVPAAAVPHRHPAAARARRRLAPARRLLAGAAGPPVRRRQALLRGVDARARAVRRGRATSGS